jgi:hypothetical protein
MLNSLRSDLLWSVAAFGFGVLAAYVDIDSFFRSKRTSYTIQLSFGCFIFIALNGTLAAGLVIWAIASDPDSGINAVVSVTSPAAKTAVIALGVPLILKSKLFSFGEDQTPAGPALAYDWARLKVLYDINMRSAIVKDSLSEKYARIFAAKLPAAKKGILPKMNNMVKNYVQPFATQDERDQLQREYESINAAHADADSLNEDHFRQLIRWTLDSTQIDYVTRQLAAM